MKALLLIAVMGMGASYAQTPPASAPSTSMPSTYEHIKALRDSGHIEEAIAEIEKDGTVHVSPDGRQMFYYEYAMAQYDAGHIKTAVDAFQKGFQTAPNGALSGMMHYQLGGLWWNKHNYAAAATQFAAAVKFKDEKNAWNYLLLGDSLQKTEHLTEARQAWTQALTASDAARTGAQGMARNALKHFAHGSSQ